MRRTLRSLFASLALLTAMLGAPPAQTKAEREALAQALRQELHPVQIIIAAVRQQRNIGEFDMLLIGKAGQPIIVSLARQ